ncbi:MAG TPA: hypothetical protein VJH03_21225 [Blastocatellia bacterium]|nr:hypothetical protein [Blastocatellia bacterium]
MAVKVKEIKLWRSEVANQPGMLASTLEPFAASGADLQVLMGYRYPGDASKAAIELYPVAGKKSLAAAKATGLSAASLPALLVEGDNKPGVAHAIAKAISGAGINLSFVVAQAVGRRYSAIFGFESEADTRKAAGLIKKATKKKKKK